MDIARKQSKGVKILCSGTSSILSTYVLSGPEAMGSFEHSVNEYIGKTGASLADAAEVVSSPLLLWSFQNSRGVALLGV